MVESYALLIKAPPAAGMVILITITVLTGTMIFLLLQAAKKAIENDADILYIIAFSFIIIGLLTFKFMF